MSSHVHSKIELQLFIYQRVLEKKKKKEYNSIDCQQQLFNIMPFFLHDYTSNCNDVMADGRE
jgi:hypothetical protein